ncbi:MAG TPA: hypothetical protein VK213_13770 [Bacteroidales bacterium]|nr:hypothetical protein [Bacteroidales bacterium]
MKLNWINKKEKLKQKFSSVRDRDLKYKLGKEKDLIGKLRKRLGKSDKDILNIIIEL